MDEELLSSRQVAELIGIKPTSFTGYISSGKVPPPDRRTGYHGCFWRRSTIESWLAARPGKGAGGGRPRAVAPPAPDRAPRPEPAPTWPDPLPPDPSLGPCIEWQGRRTRDGYGAYGERGRAHRRAWSEVHGPIPPGMVIRHRCDNPPCVRVDHLEIGTQADNVRDAVERRRSRSKPMKSREEKLATRRAYYRKNYEKMREQERARMARKRAG